MKGVYFLQISVGHTEKFWESRKLFWQESSTNNSITPLTTRLPCPQTTTPPPAREAALPCGVFSFIIFPPPPQQPHWYAPLVACFVWQRSAVVQAGDNWHGCFLGKAMTSCVSRTIMTQYGNLSGCGEIMCWTDTHPFMVIHLRTSRYPAFRFFGSFGTFDVYLWAPWKSVKLQRAHSRSRHQNRRVSQLKYMLWGFFFFFKL